MSVLRVLVTHGTILAVATASALVVWTKSDDDPKKSTDAVVQVWRGKPDQIEKIVLESAQRTVTAEAKKDALGRYFVVSLDKETAGPVQPPKKSADGGVVTPEPPKLPGPREKKTFISVSAGNSLAESLAPLMALRDVGKIEDARAEEFGFHESKGTVKVWISGKENSLTLGGNTPGGADRYVKDSGGSVFVVPGAIARDLETAESRLVERNLHDFDEDEVKRVKVTVGEITREIVRTGSGRTAHWAAPETADQKDETVGNFMQKIDRLKVTDYVEGSADDKATEGLVLRAEYLGEGGRKIGWLELVKVPSTGGAAPASGEAAGKDDFIARTEYLRWFAKVTQSVGEQIAQDVGSVVK